jgi:hypothetical protein
VGSAGIALVTLSLWPFLEPDGRRGVLIAGAIALSVQVVAFWLLLRFRRHVSGFLAVWAGGTLVRMLVIAGVATIAIRTETGGAVPMLLSLAGFFFGLLLLEPVYFRPRAGETS